MWSSASGAQTSARARAQSKREQSSCNRFHPPRSSTVACRRALVENRHVRATTSTETFAASDGAEVRVLVASPHDADSRAAVVLIPDVRGIYDHFVEVAQRFASEGLTTGVLDLYSREGAPEIAGVEDALAWMAELSDVRVLDDVRGCVAHMAVRSDPAATRVGVTGFCMGGQYALMAACTVPGIAACVSWYGMLRHPRRSSHKLADPLDMAAKLGCPYLGLFGEQDALIPLEHVHALETTLGNLDVDAQVVSYRDAGHAFFNDSRPEMYVASASADAWPRAVAFFRRHLIDTDC
jgi:carboxymethylenebutenolidase